MLPYLGVRKQV